jgi:catechol 2,3-dioxygenase-like lactoylglutathione lyase family enzyme
MTGGIGEIGRIAGLPAGRRRSLWIMQPRGVHHVSINVDDVDAALAFYVDTLGLSPRLDRPDFGFPGAWLDAGAQQVHLIGGTPPPAQGQHFALLVDDLDGAVGHLRDRGLQVSDPTPVGLSRQAFLSDPSGNQVELHQAGGVPAD